MTITIAIIWILLWIIYTFSNYDKDFGVYTVIAAFLTFPFIILAKVFIWNTWIAPAINFPQITDALQALLIHII